MAGARTQSCLRETPIFTGARSEVGPAALTVQEARGGHADTRCVRPGSLLRRLVVPVSILTPEKIARLLALREMQYYLLPFRVEREARERQQVTLSLSGTGQSLARVRITTTTQKRGS